MIPIMATEKMVRVNVSCVFISCQFISQEIIELYENKPNAIKPFGLRIKPLLPSADINKDRIETHSVSENCA